MDAPPSVRQAAEQLDLELTPEQWAQLGVLLKRVLDANAQVNLTALREPEDAWHRMVLDSLTLLPGLDMLDPGSAVADVGSGGGFPGLPLAIARPTLKFTLIESTGKKARHLTETAQALGLDHITVLSERAETLGQQPQHRQRYDAVTARAVGPMNVLLELTLPLVKVGGRLLAMKGPRLEGELNEAGDAIDLLGGGDLAVVDAYPEHFENGLVVVSLIKDRPTPKAYPREPGTPKRSPIGS